MQPCVFIHTNHRQYLGALVSAHSMRRTSPNADRFDVKIIEHKDYPFFARHEGQDYLRAASGVAGATTTCSRSRRCGSCRPS